MTPLTAQDIERIRQDFPVLQRKVHGRPLVYLDSAATSQKPRAMIRRIAEIYEHDYARVEEGHALSNEATKAFERTRAQVAGLIHAADPREVIFCRGATEAIGLVSRMFEHDGLGRGAQILITECEHHSNILPWLLTCRQSGATLRVAPVRPDGELDLLQFEAMLNARVEIVAVTHVSNVTGAIYPVKRITRMAHARGIPVLVDGAQAVPHMPVDVRDIGCDFYAGSGHKMGGPSSVGFLWGKMALLQRMPVADGGSTMAESVSFEKLVPKPPPYKFEAGEPAFGEVEAWGPAIRYWQALGLDRIAAYERELTAYAVRRLAAINRVRVLGEPADRISVVSFVVDGMEASDVAQALDAEGIAVRAGSLAAEPLLKALGVEQAVRASFMFYNTRQEVDVLAAVLDDLVR